MNITRVGTQPSAKGPEDWFTGAVRVDPLFQPNESSVRPLRVSPLSLVQERRGILTLWDKH